MSLEQIINNNENKIIFLKAILLGITYGKKENPDYYKENIEKEIENLNNLYQKEKNIKDVQHVNVLKNIEKEIINDDFNNNLINNNNNQQNIDKKILYKYTNILKNLENQKQYTINLIQTLSANHYGYNYSKINLLKTNLQFINNEIEKNKNLFKKDIIQKDIIQKNINRNIDKEFSNHKYFNNLNKFNNDNIHNKINRISPAINFSAKNTNIIKKSNINNNLEKELEYTLDNLSRLLIN
jgi:hypothetical protein